MITFQDRLQKVLLLVSKSVREDINAQQCGTTRDWANAREAEIKADDATTELVSWVAFQAKKDKTIITLRLLQGLEAHMESLFESVTDEVQNMLNSIQSQIGEKSLELHKHQYRKKE